MAQWLIVFYGTGNDMGYNMVDPCHFARWFHHLADLLLGSFGVGFHWCWISDFLSAWCVVDLPGDVFWPQKKTSRRKVTKKKTFGRAYCDLWLLVTNKDGIDDNSMALRVLSWFNVVDSALLWWIILNYGFNHAVFSGHLGGKKLGSLGWSWDSQWIQKVVRHAKKGMSFYENMVAPQWTTV